MTKPKNAVVATSGPKKAVVDGVAKGAPPPPAPAAPKQKPPAATPSSSPKQAGAPQKAAKPSTPRREDSDQIELASEAQKDAPDAASTSPAGSDLGRPTSGEEASDEAPKKRKRGPVKNKEANKKARPRKAVKESQGPANEQTRARVNAKKNQCLFRTWVAKVGDLRVKIGDRLFYKSVNLTDPEDKAPSIELQEGSLVVVFGNPTPQRVWALGHAASGTRLLLFVAPEGDTEPHRSSIFEVTKILPDEPTRPAAAGKWLEDEAERSRERKKGQKMALSRSRTTKRPVFSGHGALSNTSPDPGLVAEIEKLEKLLAQRDAEIVELRAQERRLYERWIDSLTVRANGQHPGNRPL